MGTFFTSDTHFHHKRIIQYCNRPYPDVDTMNAEMISNWQKTVRPEDEIWHLGDFSFCKPDKAREIFEQLPGRKHLIIGNHDEGRPALDLAWESLHTYYVIKPHIEYEGDDGEIQKTPHPIILFHYPIVSWEKMAYASWHLHGHCHGHLKDTGALRLDVGVDPNHFFPISLQQVQAKMALRTVVPVDHHRAKA